MIRPVLLLFFIFYFIAFACNTEKGSDYKYIGKVAFRRSYAGHQYWPDAVYDSLQNLNPSYMFDSSIKGVNVFDSIINLGIANKEKLMLNGINLHLQDTIITGRKDLYPDTVYIYYDTLYSKASIKIKNGKSLKNLPIMDDPLGHIFNLVDQKESSIPRIILIDQYYIMNGDNFEVSLYTK